MPTEQEILEKAEKRIEAKKSLLTLGVIFAFASAILMIVSFYVPAAEHWIRLPIPIMALLLGFLYVVTIGIPYEMLSNQWREDEIEKERNKHAHRKPIALPSAEELTEEDRLELRELERLKEKWER
ncbi:MAG: 2TM domain-containing protein [Bacteroidota bacterium]